MKKNFTIAVITGLLLSFGTIPAYAQTITEYKLYVPKDTLRVDEEKPNNPKTENKLNPAKNSASKSGEKKQTAIDTKTENLKERAGSEIARRIASLTHVINKISAMKRLTESQKTSLTSSIQVEIENLKLLNTKIQADTDIQTLRADVKSIVTSYRVYLLYLPQTQIIIAADKLLNTADTLSELAIKLQTRITEAKNAGKDTGNLETILTNMQTKIADAKTQANNAINAVSVLQPTDYPGNKPSLQSARSLLQTALKDLQNARQDAQKIVVELRKLNKDLQTKPAKTASESAIEPTDTPVSNPNTQAAE